MYTSHFIWELWKQQWKEAGRDKWDVLEGAGEGWEGEKCRQDKEQELVGVIWLWVYSACCSQAHLFHTPASNQLSVFSRTPLCWWNGTRLTHSSPWWGRAPLQGCTFLNPASENRYWAAQSCYDSLFFGSTEVPVVFFLVGFFFWFARKACIVRTLDRFAEDMRKWFALDVCYLKKDHKRWNWLHKAWCCLHIHNQIPDPHIFSY